MDKPLVAVGLLLQKYRSADDIGVLDQLGFESPSYSVAKALLVDPEVQLLILMRVCILLKQPQRHLEHYQCFQDLYFWMILGVYVRAV